jgi:O-antigen/teichoic acid export membrane protein
VTQTRPHTSSDDTATAGPAGSRRTAALASGGVVIAQILNAVAYAASARTLGPTHFGVLVATVGVVSTAAGFVDYGANLHCTREIAAGRMRCETALERLAARAGFGAVAMAVVCALAGAHMVGDAVTLMSLVIFTVTCAGLQAIIRGQGRVLLSSLLMLMDRATFLVGVLVTTSLPTGLPDSDLFLIPLAIGPAIGTLAGLVIAWSAVVAVRRPRHPYRSTGGFGVTAVLVSLQPLDVTLIAAIGGAPHAGSYAAVARWINPFSMLFQAICQSAAPDIARAPSHRIALLRGRPAIGLLCIGAGVAVLTGLAGPWIIRSVLGHHFTDSAFILAVLAAAMVAVAANQFGMTFLQSRGMEWVVVRLLGCMIVVQLAALSVGCLVSGAKGAAICIALAQALCAGLLVSRVRQAVGGDQR